MSTRPRSMPTAVWYGPSPAGHTSLSPSSSCPPGNHEGAAPKIEALARTQGPDSFPGARTSSSASCTAGDAASIPVTRSSANSNARPPAEAAAADPAGASACALSAVASGAVAPRTRSAGPLPAVRCAVTSGGPRMPSSCSSGGHNGRSLADVPERGGGWGPYGSGGAPVREWRRRSARRCPRRRQGGCAAGGLAGGAWPGRGRGRGRRPRAAHDPAPPWPAAAPAATAASAPSVCLGRCRP